MVFSMTTVTRLKAHLGSPVLLNLNGHYQAVALHSGGGDTDANCTNPDPNKCFVNNVAVQVAQIFESVQASLKRQ